MDEQYERSALLSAPDDGALRAANGEQFNVLGGFRSQHALCHGAFEFAGCDRIRRGLHRVGSVQQAFAFFRFCRRRSDLFAYELQSPPAATMLESCDRLILSMTSPQCA